MNGAVVLSDIMNQFAPASDFLGKCSPVLLVIIVVVALSCQILVSGKTFYDFTWLNHHLLSASWKHFVTFFYPGYDLDDDDEEDDPDAINDPIYQIDLQGSHFYFFLLNLMHPIVAVVLPSDCPH